jgi:hypothetical protein
MCWMCDHPAATRQDYLDQTRRIITESGWAVQYVEREGFRGPYAYTVGLTARGKPELVVTGMPAARAAELLNDVAAHVLHAEPPQPGDQVRLTGGPLLEVVEVEVPDAHLFLVGELYGADFLALQLVHADDRDRWPWEVGYRGRRGGQPVLGPRVRSSPQAAAPPPAP